MEKKLVELSLELTNRCLRRCLHCSSGSELKALPDELHWRSHMSLIVEARGLGATVLSLSGGEPLLYEPDSPRLLGDLIEVAQDYKEVLIYTTGKNDAGNYVYMYPEIERLLTFPNVKWIFSLHSHIAEMNDHIMQDDGALEQICESINFLVRRDKHVEIHFVPMAINYKDMFGTLWLCGELGVKKMSLLRFVPQTRGKDAVGLHMTQAQFTKMQYMIDTILHAETDVEVRAGCPIDFRHAVGLLGEKPHPCHAGDDLILVRPTGAVHPCAAWKSLPVDFNVKDHSDKDNILEEVWYNSEVFNAIRAFKDAPDEFSNPGYRVIDGVCRTCSRLASCKTGCPAQRLHAYGEDWKALYTNKPDPLCPRR